jgi:hypothetical protein
MGVDMSSSDQPLSECARVFCQKDIMLAPAPTHSQPQQLPLPSQHQLDKFLDKFHEE